MIKLLIVDDEHIVIDSIKFIIEKYIEDVEVVGTARSGREAIEKALNLRPDVVFMDIHMPGINGMDAIRRIKATHKDMNFVIITAYEYFQYAKEAVDLGVYQYLLKPLNRKKVIKALENISNAIYEKREAINREMLLMEKINTILPHMEGQFIYSQLFTGDTTKDIAFYEEVFGMSLKQGYIMVAIVGDREGLTKEEGLEKSLIRQKFYDVFSLELKSITTCLIGPPLLDRIVAYIPVDDAIDNYQIRNSTIETAKKIVKKVNTAVRLDYKIGVGRIYNIDYFSKSYHEAYMASAIYSIDQITHFEDINISAAEVDTPYPFHKEKLLIHKILIGDTKEAVEVAEEIFSWLTITYSEDINQIKLNLIQLFISIQKSIVYDMKEKDVSKKEYLIQLFKITDMKELKNSYFNYIKSIVINLETFKQKDINDLITKSLRYLEKNYNKHISLNDVAKEINMSYHYFSKFFKESTGKNFVDYLTELRVEKSKEMLKDNTINIKEVCYKIGYTDPNYFSKIFKKSTNMTPTEYRANVLKKQEVMG
ncbi:MAG: response regulator [Clostridiaceae bacterium]|nr:response regulator [Clostridiaceae bacterium]